MSSQADVRVMTGSAQEELTETTFERFGGLCAILAGVAGLLYSVTFVVVAPALKDGGNGNLGVGLYSFFLMAGGLLTTAAIVALYNRLRETDAAMAMWGMVLSVVAALGAAVHGAYDLAISINPQDSGSGGPSQIDPRGMLTFGVAGLGLLALSWLMSRNRTFPSNLVLLGYLLSALLVIIYLGRLIVLDPKSPLILAPAALAGLIVNPAWYIWLGMVLRKRA